MSDDRAGRALRVGLIGLGEVGLAHLEAYRMTDRVDVAAIADPDEERWRDADPGLPLYTDAARMMAQEDLDLVCVLTPPATHEALVRLAAGCGLHVLCEKPLSLSLESCDRMIAACEQAEVRLFYGASYRHLPALAAARDLIRAGGIGAVRVLRESVIGGAGAAQQTMLSPAHYPAGGPGGGSMGLMDHGIHLADLFAWLTDSPVTTAYGAGNRTGSPPRPEHLTMRLANDALGSLLYDEGTFASDLPAEGQFGWGAAWGPAGYAPGGGWDPQPGCVHIHGAAGSLRAFHYANILFLNDAQGLRQIPLSGRAAPGHFATQIEVFADEIVRNLPPSSPPAAGRDALEVLLAAYRDGETRINPRSGR